MKRLLVTYLAVCGLLFAAGLCFQQQTSRAGTMTLLGAGAPTVAAAGCSQATTLIAALDGSQNNAAVTAAVCGMVTDGDYANLVGLYVLASSSAANALVNWATPGTHNATKNGTCTFNANANYTGDGSTCFFDTGVIESTIGNGVAQNSITLGSCLANNRTTVQAYVTMGVSNGVEFSYQQPLTTGSKFFYDLNGSTAFPSFTVAGTAGSWITQRTGSTTTAAFHNGSAVAGSPFADASSALIAVASVYLLAYDSGGIASPSADSLAYGFVGNGSINAANIRARLNTYVGAIGAVSC